MDIKTVSVVSKDSAYHGGEPFTINESDFDAEKHELFGVEKQAAAATDSDAGEVAKGKPKKK